jgi:mRNA-degrading endonuclease toxin of MazEF toxin-antitoxin module
MATPRRGYLYWVRLDKWRPALVLSPDYRNARAHDVIVIPCSTNLRSAPTHVRLLRGQAGAPAASVLKSEQITTVAATDVRESALGEPLADPTLKAVERAVLRAIGVPVPLEAN